MKTVDTINNKRRNYYDTITQANNQLLRVAQELINIHPVKQATVESLTGEITGEVR